jgi:Domain of unknown function (DUF4136)
MKLVPAILAAIATAALSGCATPVGPVEVTRFHAPEISALGKGTIAVEPAAGIDGSSLEFKSYAGAIARQLTLLGYTEATPASPSAQVALLRVDRQTFRPDRRRGPVSVGVGGSTGSYGSGIGLGIGIDLSGAPPAQTETTLGVTIKDRASDKALWEGKANFTVKATSPLASTQLGAAKLAEALFGGFPGTSGETIEVK